MDEIKSIIEDAIEEINKVLVTNYKDFLEKLSNKYDSLFISIPNLVGGKCFFEIQENSLLIKTDLYINENNKWLKKSEISKVPLSRFTEDGLKELKENLNKNNGKIEFDINKPNNIEELRENSKKKSIRGFLIFLVFLFAIAFCIFIYNRVEINKINKYTECISLEQSFSNYPNAEIKNLGKITYKSGIHDVGELTEKLDSLIIYNKKDGKTEKLLRKTIKQSYPTLNESELNEKILEFKDCYLKNHPTDDNQN